MHDARMVAEASRGKGTGGGGGGQNPLYRAYIEAKSIYIFAHEVEILPRQRW